MFRRQLIERLSNLFVELVSPQLAIRVALRAGQAADLVVRVLAPQHDVPALAAAEIDREVGRDPIEPSRKAGARFESGQVLESTDKCLLRKLYRIILVV